MSEQDPTAQKPADAPQEPAQDAPAADTAATPPEAASDPATPDPTAVTDATTLPERDSTGRPLTTRGATFAAAAATATPDPIGYLGASPARQASELDDKGLSQATPAVMNRAEPHTTEG